MSIGDGCFSFNINFGNLIGKDINMIFVIVVVSRCYVDMIIVVEEEVRVDFLLVDIDWVVL